MSPAHLPPGTRVGPWRVLAPRGRGAYGAVYRAFGVEEDSGPVALKLALHPGDERFAREVELLSRLRHPNVPRLVDHGTWRQPGSSSFPYLAMEWVEGVSLYEWARVQCPTSRQVLQVLASVARALEATHLAGGVHRDVKGDNVLVRAADGQVFLTDFGSGHYVGAASLTPPPFPPGTPLYRSPEAWRSVRFPIHASATPYAPGPADDVFALGVTAYRLVTGEYPPSTAPMDEASHVWNPEGPGPRPARAVNARCCAELSAVVSRMLSVRPEERGSARELAEALEHAAREAGPEADGPLFAQEESQHLATRSAPRHVMHRAAGHTPRPWLMAACVGGAVSLGAGWMLGAHRGEDAEQAHASAAEDAKDGGTAAVGDSALTAPEAPAPAPLARSIVALEVPPKPLPGQRRPDANGRCPGKSHVPIHGGCWMRVAADPKNCDEGSYLYKGACYMPVLPPARPPTSGPTKHSEDNAP